MKCKDDVNRINVVQQWKYTKLVGLYQETILQVLDCYGGECTGPGHMKNENQRISSANKGSLRKWQLKSVCVCIYVHACLTNRYFHLQCVLTT